MGQLTSICFADGNNICSAVVAQSVDQSVKPIHFLFIWKCIALLIYHGSTKPTNDNDILIDGNDNIDK